MCTVCHVPRAVSHSRIRAIEFVQANHTHNACVNYSNRNATSPTSVSGMAMGYTAAVGTSVSIAVGLGQVLNRAVLSQVRVSCLPAT